MRTLKALLPTLPPLLCAVLAAPAGAQEFTPEIERLLDCGAAMVLGAAEGEAQGGDAELVATLDAEGNALLDIADEMLAAQGLDYDARYDIGVDYATRMAELFAAGGEPEFVVDECRALLIEQEPSYDAESLLICGSAFAWAGENMTRDETGFEPALLTNWGNGLLTHAEGLLTAEGFSDEHRDILLGAYGASVGRVVGDGRDPDRTLPFCEDLARSNVKGRG